MNLPALSLRRPVLATVAAILLCVAGISALFSLPVRELPDTDSAEISIRVSYPGAAPEVMDAQVTAIIESAMAGISGVRSVVSDSERGASRTVLLFTQGRDMESAMNDVRSALDQVVGDLPEGADAPEVDRDNADSEPVMELTLASTSMDLVDLTDYANRFLVDALGRVEGVARVQVEGDRSPAMRIEIDIAKMAGLGIGIEDIVTALERNNVALPSGEIVTQTRQFQVLTDTRFVDAAEFRGLVVKQTNGNRVLLGDIATVERGPEEDEVLYRADGRAAVGLSVLRQSQANTVGIAEGVTAEIALLSRQLPTGTTLAVSTNDAVFIESMISRVSAVLLETTVIVAIVVWLFLGSLRNALIPVLTIPVSLLGALGAMALLGFSLNVISLFALILAIGLVVDDAIVVLENIQRRLADGESLKDATLNGATQVVIAIVATTVVLVAAFVPISFLEGEVGSLFREFGIVLAVAVAISAFLSLTICPVAAYLLMKDHKPGRIGAAVERCMESLTRGYDRLLGKAVANPVLVLGAAAFIATLSVGFYERLPKELVPSQDRGIFRIEIDAPQGASIAYTDKATQEIEALLEPYLADGRIANWTTVVGQGNEPKRARIAVRMPDDGARMVETAVLMKEIEARLAAITEVETAVRMPSGIGGGGAGSVRVMLGAPDMERAAEWSARLMARLGSNPSFSNISREYEANQPTFTVSVDRTRAGALGIDALAIGEALQTLFATRSVTEFSENGRQYPIVLRANAENRADAASLVEMQVRNAAGQLVPAANFMKLEERTTAPLLNRFDRFPSVEINFDVEPGYGVGQAIEDVYAAAGHLPTGARVSFDGEARTFQETSSSVGLVFVLSILIVFLALAAQFESFAKPFVILLTVPVALASALFTLLVAGQSMNVFSQIGIVLLVGLTAKNGILIVEFANQLREDGRSAREAVLEAASIRFRPILMTTIAMVAGAIPLASASGTGSETQNPLGIVLVGGFMMSAAFNLVLTPVLYSLMSFPSHDAARESTAQA